MKSKLNLLKCALSKKRNELKRESSKGFSNSLMINMLSNENSNNDSFNNSADTLVARPATTLTPLVNNFTSAHETIKDYLIGSLNYW